MAAEVRRDIRKIQMSVLNIHAFFFFTDLPFFTHTQITRLKNILSTVQNDTFIFSGCVVIIYLTHLV